MSQTTNRSKKPLLFTRIEGLLLPDHPYLTETDVCLFLREYLAGEGWQAGDTNSLISNLKKSPEVRSKPEWMFKGRAIRQAGAEMRQALNPAWLAQAVLVPIPCSKDRSHPEYDDRMTQVARIIGQGTSASVRELLVTRKTRSALHGGAKGRRIDVVAGSLAIDESCASPAPSSVGLVDDVVTTGATFQTACRVLRERFGPIAIVGLFVARRVPKQGP